MIQVKHIKKITSFILILVTALVLVACKDKGSVPYGNINNDTYLSVGDVNVTNKELYDNLRKQSSSTLTNIINKELFKGYTESANGLLDGTGEKSEWAKKLFDELVNQAIFSSTDVDSIKKNTDANIEIAIRKFVDSVYSSDASVDRTALTTALNAKLNKTQEDFGTEYYSIPALRSKYSIEIGKRLYAETILKGTDKNGEVYDEDNDNYVSDTNVISHYETNVRGQHDTDVFFFYFLNLNEANAALRSQNIKIDGRGNWYSIPDIRDKAAMVALIDSGDTAIKEYVVETAKKAGIDVTKANEADYSVREGAFKDYYDAYSPSSNRDTAIVDTEILTTMIELYNIVNENNKLSTTIDEQDGKKVVKYANGDVYQTIYTYKDLNTLSSSFRSYIYDTLSTDKPYSNLRSVSNFRYLAYKLNADTSYIDLVDEEKDSDGNKQWYSIDKLVEKYTVEEIKAAYPETVTNDTVNKEKLTELINAQKDEWKNKVIDNKLTASYTSAKVTELQKNLKVEIYDNLIRTFYNNSAAEDAKAKGKAKSGELVAKVTGTFDGKDVSIEVKADALFADLVKSYGVSGAFDLAVNEILAAKYEKDNIDKDTYKGFEKEFRTLITNFSNDQFASAGYPASIGREAFLLLVFGAKDNKEAIRNGYVLPKLREVFTADLEAQSKLLSETDNTEFVFEKLYEYVEKQYTQDFGVTVSHLLVYFDQNGDGTPDDPKEVFEKMTETEVAEVKAAIVQLYKDISYHLQNKATITSGLTEIAAQFQEAVRIPVLAPLDEVKPWVTDDANSKSLEYYRNLGLNLKYEAISSAITNVSNLPTNSSTLDTVFYDRAVYLHDLIVAEREAAKEAKEELIDGGLPYFDFGGGSWNSITEHDTLTTDFLAARNGDKPGIMSSFGFHFILATNISEKTSAKYEAPSNYGEEGFDYDKDDYTITIGDKRYNAYNENEKLSLDQIKYSVLGKKEDLGILIPTAVQSALTKYFDPVNTLYSNSYMQSAILFKLLSSEGITWSSVAEVSTAQQAAFANIKDINRNQFYTYLQGNANYEELYANWFETFKVN